MSNQIYFTGFRAEHFTGWNGVGSPSYTGVSSTSSTLDPNSVGYISLSTSGNVIWKDLSISGLEPVYFCVAVNSGTAQNSYGSFFITDGSNAIRIFPISSNDNQTNDIIRFDTGTYDTTNRFTQVASSTIYINQSTSTLNPRQVKFFLKIYSSNNTTYDKVDFCATSTASNSLSSATTITLSNPLTSIKSIYSTSLSSNNLFFYCVVSNFDLTWSYLDYTTASSVGSTNQWSGDVTSFSTYPVNYLSTGGMYSNTTGTSVRL